MRKENLLTYFQENNQNFDVKCSFENLHDFKCFYVNESFVHRFIIQYDVNFILISFVLFSH